MAYAFLADAVLVLHGLFIFWVVFGGLAVIARPLLAWLHVPAVAWAAWVSWSGSYCPLTPLEQSLRRATGQAGYEGGFIEHYVGALIYPEGLTANLQMLYGATVLVINLALYAVAITRAARRRRLP
jgi:Protein of Unknown function (DUF2784)